MKVSIVIPIYKAEKYMKQCVDSVLAQTYKNIEVILVEDGSPDRCGEICDEYAKEDTRIKVIHKENEGVSKARNEGLSLATGEYIQFVDSDDYLESNMIELLVSTMEQQKVDLVVCGFYEENQSFSRISSPGEHTGTYSKKEILENITQNPYSLHYGVLWNKLYKNEYIKEQLRFQEDMDFGEDFIFNLGYLANIKEIYVLEEPLYRYIRYNGDSLMYRQTKGKEQKDKYLEYLEKRLLIFKRYRDFYISQMLYEDNKNKINAYLLKVYVSEKTELYTLPFSRNEKKECKSFLSNNPDVIQMKADMEKRYYYKMSLRYSLAKCKVLLRNKLVKN